jgi:CheY-like chemotaxis protein
MSRLQQKRVVLYADDDLEDLDFVREALKSYANNIELRTFTDASELLKFSRMSARGGIFPCLIILDINMPGLNGKEALKILRDISGYEDVPVVLFTTSTLPFDLQFAERHGAELITKPLNAEQMNLTLKKFLAHCGDGIKNFSS